MGLVRPTLTPRQSSHEERSSEGYCIGFRCYSSLQADPSWRAGWLGSKPRRASWSWGRPPLSSRRSGRRWWSRCSWGRWDLTRTQASASTEASLCLWSTHEADTVSHIWNTRVPTSTCVLLSLPLNTWARVEPSSFGLRNLTFLSVYQVMPPRSRGTGSGEPLLPWYRRMKESRGNRCESGGYLEKGWRLCGLSGAHHWRYCWPQHHRGQWASHLGLLQRECSMN